MLPRPASIAFASDSFSLNASTPVTTVDPALAHVAAWLRHRLSSAPAYRCAPSSAAAPSDGMRFPSGDGSGDDRRRAEQAAEGIRLTVTADMPAEGYRLRVRSNGVEIGGGDPAGVFYGSQTLLQMLPAAVYRRASVHTGQWNVPGIDIEDAPRFGWRGCMLDVARHFLPKADLLRFIDLLAMHKLNVLHLHLTDDQGWRLEIRRYPRLTEIGSWRRESMVGSRQHERFNGRPHGGFYSQDDIREIVAYAAQRFITVVPEIDLPGHVQAALAAYPELGNRPDEPVEVSTRWGISRRVLNVSDDTIAFVRNVFDEVVELFPSHHIGIGGDECLKDEWRDSPAAQQRMRALGLTTEDELQSWFVDQIQEHLHGHGRRVFGWDEILEGGRGATVTVAAWRGPAVAAAAARAGHDVVSCPDASVYLDYRQSDDPQEPIPVGTVLTWQDVRRFDPVPPGLPEEFHGRILGGQCNVWTEHADNPRAVDYLVFPRLCALAEVLWSGPLSDADDFGERLRGHLARLDAIGVEYRPLDGPHPWQQRPEAPGWPRQTADRVAELARLTANVPGI